MLLDKNRHDKSIDTALLVIQILSGITWVGKCGFSTLLITLDVDDMVALLILSCLLFMEEIEGSSGWSLSGGPYQTSSHSYSQSLYWKKLQEDTPLLKTITFH